MVVLHVIQGISHSSGGPSRSVQGLVAALCADGIDAWLMALCVSELPWVDGVEHFINGEPFERVALRVKPDIVHLHGIWSLDLHKCAAICRRIKVPYVIAPRGMLEPWSLAQKSLKKRIARWLYQDRDLRCAAALHATAESEAEQFRRLGFKNPVIVSPNGVNVPQNFNHVEYLERVERRALFVSRMHPKKGVLELVEAWDMIRPKGWKCELVYTVSGELEKEYETKVKTRAKELGLQDQFVFTGALNDGDKWAAYARADLFVLPTYSENFGIVVAEALWAGIPVITTKGTPWQELDLRGCGWWIDIGVKPLARALKDAMSQSDETRKKMGERGRNLVGKKYTWDAAVGMMVAGYTRVHNGGYK